MTIKDIAQMAGVSPSTVSRSLNDSQLISGATKERVREIAAQIGFEFNSSARGLVTQQIGTIGMVLPDDFDQLYVQVYHSALHNHLRRALERSDLDLLVSFSHNRFSGYDNVVKLVRRNKVDGLIVVQPSLSDETEAFLRERGVPYVFSHYPPGKADLSVDRVYVDHEKGGMLAGELFVRLGFTKILSFRSPDHELEFDLRLKGLRKAFAAADHKAEVYELDGRITYESGYELVQTHLQKFTETEALFAINDLMAIGMLHAMQASGIRVPQQVSLVGYDGSPLAATMRPRLTTVGQPAEEVAFLTCERLISMIEDRATQREHQPRSIALQPRLVLGETTPEEHV